MPKRRHKPRKPSRGPGRTPRRDHPDEADSFLRSIGDALRESPVEFLGLVATMLNASDTRRAGGWGTPEPEVPRDALIDGLLSRDRVETTALLTAIATLAGDDLLATRINRGLAGRRHHLPTWLAQLDAAQPLRNTVALTHVLGDGDDILIGAHLADGSPLTAVVYIDHNLNTLVKDAFVFPHPVEVVTDTFLEIGDADSAAVPLDPADARARITAAIEHWAMTLGPIESESWPACRPIIEWLARMLPEGGRSYEMHEWTDKELDTIAARFLASDLATGLDDATHRGLLDSLLFFGSGWAGGDPLRWSAVNAEILLLDWIPRKLREPVAVLALVPELLKAFVRHCHRERGIRTDLTDDVLAAVDEMTPEYLQIIGSPRLQGPQALLAQMGVLGDAAARAAMFHPEDSPHTTLERVRRAVGEKDLDTLDDTPLPDEPFAWDGVPDDVHDRVREVLILLDDVCTSLLSVEYRTAARRLLADVAAGDPKIFRRKARAETAAAALCWIVCAANSERDLAPIGRPTLTTKAIMSHLGLPPGSPRSRATPMLHAIDVDPHADHRVMLLGTPRYLVAARRADLIRTRDELRAADV